MMNNRRTGMALVGVGILFVLLRVTGFTFGSLMWPLWVLLPGAFMLFAAFKDGDPHSELVVPGAIVGGTGAILFFLNMTDRWEAWSYMWALYPVFVGSALYYTGRANGDEKLMRSGKQTARTGLYMLVGFGLMFELLIFGGLGFLDSALLPAILIGAGLYLMYANDKVRVNLDILTNNKRKGKPKNDFRDENTGIDPDLRSRMDEALAEEEHSVPA